MNDSTGVPVASSYIYLFVGSDCRTTTDPLGRFVVQRVPSGQQRIETGSPGYRQFRPVHVTVTPANTTYIELRLVPGGPLEDCRAVPGCSPLVDGGAGAIDDDSTGFRVVALGTAIGLSWETVGDERWYACVEGEQEEVVEALSQRYRPVVDAEECELSGRQMRHVDTNGPAFRPRINRVVELSPDRRTVSLFFHGGPLWGAFWECDFERTDRGWRATRCILTMVA